MAREAERVSGLTFLLRDARLWESSKKVEGKGIPQNSEIDNGYGRLWTHTAAEFKCPNTLIRRDVEAEIFAAASNVQNQ